MRSTPRDDIALLEDLDRVLGMLPVDADRVQAAGFILHEYGIDIPGSDGFSRSGISAQSVLYIVEKR
jgi:hypothetical protein